MTTSGVFELYRHLQLPTARETYPLDFADAYSTVPTHSSYPQDFTDES